MVERTKCTSAAVAVILAVIVPLRSIEYGGANAFVPNHQQRGAQSPPRRKHGFSLIVRGGKTHTRTGVRMALAPPVVDPSHIDLITSALDHIHTQLPTTTDQLQSSLWTETARQSGEAYTSSLWSSTLSMSDASSDVVPLSEVSNYDLVDMMPEQREFVCKEYNIMAIDSAIVTNVPIAAIVLAFLDFGINRLFKDDVEEMEREMELDASGWKVRTVDWLKRFGWRMGALGLVIGVTVILPFLTIPMEGCEYMDSVPEGFTPW